LQYDAGVALSSLACFISPDLARDLSGDIMTLLTSTKPYLRKKAVLILYKVFLRYPEALRPAFPRLREKLEDPDPGVQSAAVNVICELARKNPKNYLSLAPTFFKLMTTSTNNWMLIKIIKLFGALTPLEPRLGKKLIEPLTNLIHSTSAMSLLYECINTVIAVLISISSGMPNHAAAIQLCVQKLRILIEDSDQNLKYLGLLAMSKILKTNPKSVQGHKDLVMQCLDDSDESIRLRALDLLYGMVSKKNLMEIVKKLMLHMEKADGSSYRDELMEKIVKICSQNDYQHITNFEWYVSVLVELARAKGGSEAKHGSLIAAQMMDVAIRVESVRAFAVAQMALLIENSHLLLNCGSNAGSRGGAAAEVLYAACWICGEFARHLPDARDTLRAMFRGKLSSLPAHVQAVYIQNGLKLFVFAASKESGEPLLDLAKELEERLSALLTSSDLEVQERASSALQIVQHVILLLNEAEGLHGQQLAFLFAGDLNPVGPKAQKKVPVPEGLDLDAWINEPPPEKNQHEELESDEEDEGYDVFVESAKGSKKGKKKGKKKRRHNAEESEPTEEEIREARSARLLEQSMNPNYLKDSCSSPANATGGEATPVEDIPVQSVDLGASLHIPGLATADQYLNISRDSSDHGEKKKGKKKKKRRQREMSEDSVESGPSLMVSKNVEMPEGAEDGSEGDEGEDLAPDDPHRALADVKIDDLDYQRPYKADVDQHDGSAWRRGEDSSIPASLFGEKTLKKEEEEPAKKHKKKKKHKEKEMVNGEEKAKKKAKKSKKEKVADKVPEADDVDFWLSQEVK